MSRVVPGLLGMSLGHPRISQVVPGLLGMSLGHPRISQVVPGLLGIFEPGTMVVVSGRTSREILSCPKTSLDL